MPVRRPGLLLDVQIGLVGVFENMAIHDDPAALISEGVCYPHKRKDPKVAIIGAGPAGLCAARHLFADDSGITGFVFEQKSTIGGTWVYTDETGKDKHGQQIHSPLYYGLETNLPKEIMEFTDFPTDIPDKSYLSSEEYLDYLNKYAQHHNVLPHIKLNHLVTRVAPVGKSWSLTALDLETKVEHVSLYDAILVCSGPTSIPVYPKIDGLARFSGKQLHSNSFRRGETYKGQRVLVIGLGPSGLDISFKLLPHAKQVVLSHNFESLRQLEPPKDVIFKPAASSMLDNTVTFIDGSSVEVDVVIHCTGYTYNFPFLTKECGISVNQYVSPLYLHMFNIEAPTMAILGVPRLIPYQYCVEYQAKAFLAMLKGEIEMPTKEEMLRQMEDEMKERIDAGSRRKDFHKMGKRSKSYMESLQKLANLPSIPEVRYNIFFDAFSRALKDFEGFRFTKYKILDDENFEVEILERPPPLPPAEPAVTPTDTEPTEADPGNESKLSSTEENDETVVEPELETVIETPQENSRNDELSETRSKSCDISSLEEIISTIQAAMSGTKEVKETVESRTHVESSETTSTEISESSSEIVETTSEIVSTIVSRTTVQEIVEKIETSGASKFEVEAVVENMRSSCDKSIGEDRLIVTQNHQKEEVIDKHR